MIHDEDGGCCVRRQVTFRSDEHHVWQALTNAEHQALWLAQEASFDESSGGHVVWQWSTAAGCEFGKLTGTVTHRIEESYLALQLHRQSCWPGTRLGFLLAPCEAGTRLALEQSGFAPEIDLSVLERMWVPSLAQQPDCDPVRADGFWAARLEALRCWVDFGELDLGRLRGHWTFAPGAAFIAKILEATRSAPGRSEASKSLSSLRDSVALKHARYLAGRGIANELDLVSKLAQGMPSPGGDRVRLEENPRRLVLERRRVVQLGPDRKQRTAAGRFAFDGLLADYEVAVARTLGYRAQREMTPGGYKLVFESCASRE
ncbi:MAG: SRPBCC domain-containing protein [Candidatus Riflebacteria bacterium]|nr:SRPBCC domain-containing protein [Candidatus Riflebacteria bacterium]